MPLKNDLYMLDIQTMDAQHIEIHTIAHNLETLFQNTTDSKKLLAACNDLVIASRKHFDSEERLMLKYFYPDTEAHIGLHMTYTNILATLIGNIKGGFKSEAKDTLTYLLAWHRDHIRQADKQYAQYIQGKSV